MNTNQKTEWSAAKIWQDDKPVEIADAPRCELCGSVREEKYSAKELLSRLATLADKSQGRCLIMIYALSGMSQQKIAGKFQIEQYQVSREIKKGTAYIKS